jgi:hypothetical protein
MTTTESLAFICMVCARAVRESHVPPTAPKCPSCGAKTKPNAAMQAKAGNVTCLHCGHAEPAYTNVCCPRCDTVYGTFSTRAEKA